MYTELLSFGYLEHSTAPGKSINTLALPVVKNTVRCNLLTVSCSEVTGIHTDVTME